MLKIFITFDNSGIFFLETSGEIDIKIFPADANIFASSIGNLVELFNTTLGTDCFIKILNCQITFATRGSDLFINTS